MTVRELISALLSVEDQEQTVYSLVGETGWYEPIQGPKIRFAYDPYANSKEPGEREELRQGFEGYNDSRPVLVI